MSAAPSRSFLKFVALLLLFTSVPGTLYILYTRTGGPESKKELAFQKNLRYALMAGGETLDLAPLTDWPWVKVCAVGNGLSEEEFNDVVGFEYEHFAELHWMHLENYWTLVFADHEREANWGMTRPVTPVRIPRDALAELRLPPGVDGVCIDQAGEIRIERRAVPVGVSPITLSFTADASAYE